MRYVQERYHASSIFFRNFIPLFMTVFLAACGGSSDNTTTVDPQPQNQAPVSNAGQDVSVPEGNEVVLQGTGSDADGTISTYTWTQTAGLDIELQNANSATATFLAPAVEADEVLEFTLTVTDNDGASDLDSVSVTIQNMVTDNQAPVANAGQDVSVPEGNEVMLQGTGSDADGIISTYTWTQTAGLDIELQNANTATGTFLAPAVEADEVLEFTLTVTDNDGASDSDSVSVTIQNVVPGNQVPVANAGQDAEILEGTVTDLNGSASSDGDGSIVSYLWQQSSDDRIPVTLENADTASTRFTIPNLAENTQFSFTLTVTDNDGLQSQDTVTITGRPTPGVSVTDLIGNTTTFNSVAEFGVSLTTQPSEDVTIEISTSDATEAVADPSLLVFTPENWLQSQQVLVTGVNNNVINGEQNYQILLSAAISEDSFYNGLDPADISVQGIALSIEEPASSGQFITGLESTITPNVRYSGNGELSFSLTSSPAGMLINLNTGVITWTPSENDRGQSFELNVAVNDGNLFANTSFTVSVAAPEPVTTEVSGNTLIVNDPTTSLNGVTITQLVADRNANRTGNSNSVVDLALTRLEVNEITALPEWIVPLTDVIVVEGEFNQEIELRFTIPDLPSGISIGAINLYAYTNALDIEESFWTPVSVEISYEGTVEAPIAVIRLNGLEGLAVLGYTAPSQSSTSGRPTSNQDALISEKSRTFSSTASTVSCTQQFAFPNNQVPLDVYKCSTSTNANVNITMSGFGSQNTRWGGATKEDLIGWLLDAQGWFSTNALGFENAFNVSIHQMDYLGYVTTGNQERRNTLHITDDNTQLQTTIQGTAVHEYFHHAQGHPDTQIANQNLLIDSRGNSRWLIEGTARWFEDELYDDLDTYVGKEGGRGSRIAEAGLNSPNGRGIQRPYQRFSFFKLLTKSCSNFATALKNVLNIDAANDSSGINNLETVMTNNTCNFGNHLGADKSSSIEAALAYYNYATQLKGQITLLDSNESDTAFSFRKPNYQFNQTWLSTVTEWLGLTDNARYRLNNVNNIPAVGAYSFEVEAVTGELPEGKIAELVVESAQELLVSITSSDSAFVGTNTIGSDKHTWFSTTAQSSYIYNSNQRIPKLFVTLINPSKQSSSDVEVYFNIRDDIDVDTIITSHTTGDQVANRVITIAGLIPEEARDVTTKVSVTTNGLVTDTSLNSDGTFVVDVVVSLGENIVKAQAFNGASPVTNEEIVNLKGVESGSIGRNALLASRVVYVLRWDTPFTDVDIYSSDKNGETLWWSNRSVADGNLDVDDVSGFGPEVISYRANDSDIYVNGNFEVDVHYYSGSPSTNYTLDVILNETEGANRRSLKFESITPLTDSSSSASGVNGSGPSRFNDILLVSCSGARVCSLSGFDASKLQLSGTSSAQDGPNSTASFIKSNSRQNSYQQCVAELSEYSKKHAIGSWSCSPEGLKVW